MDVYEAQALYEILIKVEKAVGVGIKEMRENKSFFNEYGARQQVRHLYNALDQLYDIIHHENLMLTSIIDAYKTSQRYEKIKAAE